MKNVFQKTLSKSVNFKGIGLHSGKNVSIKVMPAKVNEGIVFKRVDLVKNNLIKANFVNVSSAKLCTTLKNNHGVKVSTVEHLLAALYLADIDNAIIEIDNNEVPIMDGSAKIFLESFKNLEVINLKEKRKFLKIEEKIELIDGSKKISIEPSDDTFEVEFQLNYDNSIIGNQKNTINFDKDNFEDIYKSRTFCLYNDIEKIKKAGLAKGGSLDNAVVVNENQVLNEGGLRNKKEFVNHKILDLVGDFLLSGKRILGKVKCYEGGHELTNKFLRKMFSSDLDLKKLNANKSKIAEKFVTNQSTKLAVNA
tara:strand:- start:1430 stop:2356 length:927 start_codon:yes stop_codon:yes gene_type:complete